MLGVSLRQVDKLCAEGVLTPLRLTENGNRRFRVSDLAQLVGNNTNEED